ncbi:cell wall-binding repeat-containing protein [Fictibacillus nanhaiensis]|uniref:Cell wall-binding repeat-containing protein n=1 Tax=Fictibacillus nanhaiensis TaxID=742169 RepID=A0ABS2ZSC9_9BACL|nr:cell wall-binding repeat-containing protein [Fictibacillus nanhaiensis]
MKKHILLFLVLFCILLWGDNRKVDAAYLKKERLSGKDRFEVAVNVSKKGWSSSDTVFLTNYMAFADALAASPLAFKNNAPILLSRSERLTDTTRNEIVRLGVKHVVIIGGTGSIYPAVASELKAMNISTRRIEGQDRFEVAYNISKELDQKGKAIVTYGLNFSDALAIAPYAAKNGYPILLTHKDQLNESTKKALAEKNIKQTYVIGGEGSVSKAVYNQLPQPSRIGGKNRYEVAANIIRQLELSTEKVYMATGQSFADALTGSVLAAKESSPLLLTYPKSIPSETINIMGDKNITNLTILGGHASVYDQSFTVFHNWEITKSGGNRLQGYTSKTSVKPGELQTFYLKSNKPFELQIFRMGHYDGEGGTLVRSMKGFNAHIQPRSFNTENMDAGWRPTTSFTIPKEWKSGFYLAKITNLDNEQSYMPFVVSNPNPFANVDAAVLISTNTYQAYNNWGGKSMYGYNSANKVPAIKLSFNRPYTAGNGAGEFFAFEYNLVRWLEKQNYNLTYLTDDDVHKGALNTLNAKSLIIAGHDEYWSKEMRDSIEEQTNSKMNIGLFSANVGYWQIRMEKNNRVMVGYKARAFEDPYQKIDPSKVTTTFRSSPVNRPENQVFGMMYHGIPEKTMPLVITNATHWLYKDTGLKNGEKISGVVGGEIDRYDKEIPNVEVIAASPVKLYGKESVSHVIWYQKPQGGKVFATGTFYWNWFLDPYGKKDYANFNQKIEQITINAMNELLK